MAPEHTDYRATQRANWGAAAPGWMQWSEFNDLADRHISQRLVELAGVQSGSRVLDVAAGYGEPALTAARAVGAQGTVVATDISGEMLGFARERVAEAGVANVEFVQTDAISLDFPPASFDAAVSRWGIIFDPDGEAAAARVRELLRPSGRFAIASWGLPEEVPFLSLPMRTTLARFELDGPSPGTPGPLSRPTPESLAALLEEGGFNDVQTERGEIVYAFESPAHFTEYVKAIAAPIRALIEQHAPDDQDAAWGAITAAATELAGGDGPLSLHNAVLLAAGRR